MAEVAGGDNDSNTETDCTAPKEKAATTEDAALKSETGGESDDDEVEDVYEVESILDSKFEEGETLYRVRWKGYDSDGDTWEPEAHLEDCKEVLLAFKKNLTENKQKAQKKELPKLSSSDLFDADSDSEFEQKDSSPQKKKKKSRDDDNQSQEEVKKKKKSKSEKPKEKYKSDAESSGNQSPESKPKKRTSDGKEDLNHKKQKKDELKEFKKIKRDDSKETKLRGKEEYKEKEKKTKKEKLKEPEQPVKDSPVSLEPVVETTNTSHEMLPEDKNKVDQDKDGNKEKDMDFGLPEDHLSDSLVIDEDAEEEKMKKKKKKHKKMKNEKERVTLPDEIQSEKKSSQKKQKHLEKIRELPAVEKTQSIPTPIQKSSRLSSDEKMRKSVDSVTEEKETRKTEEKPRKKHDTEKEVKKEHKVLKTAMQEKQSSYDPFKISSEDKYEYPDISRKREEMSFDQKSMDDFKSKEHKQPYKERRNMREDTDPWSFTASEGDQEVIDPVCHMHDSSGTLESKSQVGLGMDLQLEWMTLDDFQKHLDGADEILPTEAVTNNALKDAIKNGDYLTVKFALNSTEEYNLDQEDSSGMTLMMMAAAAGQDDLLRLLIKKGAKINARQKNGTTALIHAAEKNHLTTVALLLEAGAYVNVQQASGETALIKACKKGNWEIARLLLEHGADCNVLSKHQGSAVQFAKQSNNVVLYESVKRHLEMLSRVVEDAIRDYFETRLVLLEPVFPIACHRLCEGPDFSLDFNYKPPYNIPEGSGILLFVFHANFFGKEVVVRLCGPCSVQAVVLNDKFQLPVFLDSHFIYSFSPVVGVNKLFIRLSEASSAKVKLLVCAYRVQLQ
ncbi:M-phase phosphoprotein 8 [Bombina bombina]|uniref:M-phase phosphoprotein 8 n=1 Tax=Bombina bombina TaxID=8345 RepID=UPI00235A786D|nr:M-phase phosphoprotein 8 [Bombina bombina]